MGNSTKPKLSQLESHLGYWLRFVSNHVSSGFQKLLEAEGISVTEWVALRTLFDKPETTHAELSQTLGMTKGAISKVLTRLEDKGFAKRELAKGSLREQVLVLTPRGKTQVPKLCALADRNDAQFFSHLEPHERDMLMRLLQTLVKQHGLTAVPID